MCVARDTNLHCSEVERGAVYLGTCVRPSFIAFLQKRLANDRKTLCRLALLCEMRLYVAHADRAVDQITDSMIK